MLRRSMRVRHWMHQVQGSLRMRRQDLLRGWKVLGSQGVLCRKVLMCCQLRQMPVQVCRRGVLQGRTVLCLQCLLRWWMQMPRRVRQVPPGLRLRRQRLLHGRSLHSR